MEKIFTYIYIYIDSYIAIYKYSAPKYSYDSTVYRFINRRFIDSNRKPFCTEIFVIIFEHTNPTDKKFNYLSCKTQLE